MQKKPIQKLLEFKQTRTNANTVFYTASYHGNKYTIAEYGDLGFVVFLNESTINLNKRIFATVLECEALAEGNARSLTRIRA